MSPFCRRTWQPGARRRTLRRHALSPGTRRSVPFDAGDAQTAHGLVRPVWRTVIFLGDLGVSSPHGRAGTRAGRWGPGCRRAEPVPLLRLPHTPARKEVSPPALPAPDRARGTLRPDESATRRPTPSGQCVVRRRAHPEEPRGSACSSCARLSRETRETLYYRSRPAARRGGASGGGDDASGTGKGPKTRAAAPT